MKDRIDEIMEDHTSTMGFVAVRLAMEQYGRELLVKAADEATCDGDVGPGGEGYTCKIDKDSILNTTL